MIHHVAIWVSDLENMKDFYVKYFDGISNTLYHNQKTNFKSYFISFENGAKLELMQMPDINETKNSLEKQFIGLAHISFSVGSAEKVDVLTEQLLSDGYTLASAPRMTGDGFYESCILDPESNRV